LLLDYGARMTAPKPFTKTAKQREARDLLKGAALGMVLLYAGGLVFGLWWIRLCEVRHG